MDGMVLRSRFNQAHGRHILAMIQMSNEPPDPSLQINCRIIGVPILLFTLA